MYITKVFSVQQIMKYMVYYCKCIVYVYGNCIWYILNKAAFKKSLQPGYAEGSIHAFCMVLDAIYVFLVSEFKKLLLLFLAVLLESTQMRSVFEKLDA